MQQTVKAALAVVPQQLQVQTNNAFLEDILEDRSNNQMAALAMTLMFNQQAHGRKCNKNSKKIFITALHDWCQQQQWQWDTDGI